MDGRQRVRAALDQAGLSGRVRELEQSARSAKEAAAALGCEVGAIGSSLVLMADASAILVVTSGAHRVDLELVASHLAVATLRMATPEQVRETTGFAIGGVAPVGHATGITVLVDEDLVQHPQIWTAAGHPHVVFWSTYGELLELTGGQPVRVA